MTLPLDDAAADYHDPGLPTEALAQDTVIAEVEPVYRRAFIIRR